MRPNSGPPTRADRRRADAPTGRRRRLVPTAGSADGPFGTVGILAASPAHGHQSARPRESLPTRRASRARRAPVHPHAEMGQEYTVPALPTAHPLGACVASLLVSFGHGIIPGF